MRDFSCYYARLYKNKLYRNSNTACWASFAKLASYYNGDTLGPRSVPKTLYISEFQGYRCPEKLLHIINKITPCYIKTIQGKDYIVYKIINKGHYGSNLILLTFIRMIWYNSNNLNNDGFFKSLDDYSYNDDPISFLLGKITDNINEGSSYNYGNHSLVYKNLKERTVEELLNVKTFGDDLYCARYWLTGN